MVANRAWLTACLLLSCCAPIDEGVAEHTQAISSSNGLSTNALTRNALTMNALTTNALTKNALTKNALAGDPSVAAALMDPAQGVYAAEVIKYSARCMLRADQSVTVTFASGNGHLVTATYPGNLGLQPAWTSQGLTETDVRWWVACLGSHVNASGKPVRISVRGDHPALLGWSTQESTSYAVPDAAYYGTFDPTATPSLRIYTCEDRFSWSTTSTQRKRLCAVDDLACGDMFKSVGPCHPSPTSTSPHACEGGVGPNGAFYDNSDGNTPPTWAARSDCHPAASTEVCKGKGDLGWNYTCTISWTDQPIHEVVSVFLQ
jgi:hypothetical protein